MLKHNFKPSSQIIILVGVQIRGQILSRWVSRNLKSIVLQPRRGTFGQLYSGSQYSVSVRAATTWLLFSCCIAWVYPHIIEDSVLENIKGWVMDENDGNWKDESGAKKLSGFEILKTFSTGLLAVCLAGEMVILTS